jgi:hypothetical protein
MRTTIQIDDGVFRRAKAAAAAAGKPLSRLICAKLFGAVPASMLRAQGGSGWSR